MVRSRANVDQEARLIAPIFIPIYPKLVDLGAGGLGGTSVMGFRRVDEVSATFANTIGHKPNWWYAGDIAVFPS